MGCAALTLLGGGNRNFLSGANLFTVGSGLAAAIGLDNQRVWINEIMVVKNLCYFIKVGRYQF